MVSTPGCSVHFSLSQAECHHNFWLSLVFCVLVSRVWCSFLPTGPSAFTFFCCWQVISQWSPRQGPHHPMSWCSSFFPCGYNKILWQKQLKKERTHNSRVKSILVGKSRQQELEAAGHITFLVRRRVQWVGTFSVCFHYFIQSSIPCPGNSPTYNEEGSSPIS